MQSADMVNAVTRILDRAGWEHTRHTGSCFDLFAASGERSLILKVAANVDSTNRDDTEEMKQACRFLGAAPVVVGTRSSRRELRPQVIYERYGVPAIRPDTLDAYLRLQERTPVMNRRGGYYVSIDTDELEEQRREEGYSVNALAKEVGVSRRTIVNYREKGVAQYEKAQRLEEVLGDVTASIDIFHTRVEVSRARSHPVADRLTDIGMEAAGFSRAGFDAAARDAEDRFVARQQEGSLPDHLHGFLRRLTEMSGSTTFLVTDDRDAYDGIAVIAEDQLESVQNKDDLKAEIDI